MTPVVYSCSSVAQGVTCDPCLQVSINRGASSLSELGGDTLGFPITQRVLSVEDRDSPDDSLLYVLSSAPRHGYIINRALGNRSISNWTQGTSPVFSACLCTLASCAAVLCTLTSCAAVLCTLTFMLLFSVPVSYTHLTLPTTILV